MNRFISLSIIALCIISLSGCVSKRNYLDLEAKLRKSNEELGYTTTEKMNFQNISQELDGKVKNLEAQVTQLIQDTLSLTKMLNDSERQLVKSKLDYDELLKNFTSANSANDEQVNKLLQNLDSIRMQLDNRKKELDEKAQQLTDLQNAFNQKNLEMQALKDKVTNALKGFMDKGLNVHEKEGKVYVSMDEKLLFSSGSWRVSANGLDAIQELATVLAADTTINIMVEGHTDNVAYRGSGDVKDNWDLSVLRATSVLKALLKEEGIAPERITAAGRGEFMPIASNETKEDRAKNRRTEIILTPNIDEVLQIIDAN